MMSLTKFSIIYVPRQHLQGQLQKLHSVDTVSTAQVQIIFITEKEKHKDNSHKASFGNSTVEKLLFILDTTKKSKEVIRI
jgi:uncharacterized protein YlbG (UPF0298 family)